MNSPSSPGLRLTPAAAMGASPRAGKGEEFLFPEWAVHVTLLVLQASLGLYHVLAKIALEEGVDQLVFCVYRDAIALLLLGPGALLLESSLRPASSISARLMRQFLLLGATGILGNQLLFLVGLNYTSPATAAALQPSIQVFTFTLALMLGLETFRRSRVRDWAKLAGVLVCVSGAAVLGLFRGPALVGAGNDPPYAHSAPPPPLASSAPWGLSAWPLGVLSLLGNCACMAMYLAFQAPVLAEYPAPMSVTAMAYLFGAGLMLAMALLLSLSSPRVWAINRMQALAVAYAGVVNSAVGYFLVAWANRRVGPTAVAMYTPLQPLSSTLLSFFILGDAIFLGTVLGGSLVLSGLYLYVWGKSASLSEAALAKSHLPLAGQEQQPQQDWGQEGLVHGQVQGKSQEGSEELERLVVRHQPR